MESRQVAQAVQLISALSAQLDEMTARLTWVERRGATTKKRSVASAMGSEAAALRRDIDEARVLIDGLCSRYLIGSGAQVTQGGLALRTRRPAQGSSQPPPAPLQRCGGATEVVGHLGEPDLPVLSTGGAARKWGLIGYGRHRDPSFEELVDLLRSPMQSFVAARRAHRRENEGLLIRCFLLTSSGSIGWGRSGAPGTTRTCDLGITKRYHPTMPVVA